MRTSTTFVPQLRTSPLILKRSVGGLLAKEMSGCFWRKRWALPLIDRSCFTARRNGDLAARLARAITGEIMFS
jgi:hypothetical protein